MIAYMNLVTGPFLTVLVVLMSVDAGSLWRAPLQGDSSGSAKQRANKKRVHAW